MNPLFYSESRLLYKDGTNLEVPPALNETIDRVLEQSDEENYSQELIDYINQATTEAAKHERARLAVKVLHERLEQLEQQTEQEQNLAELQERVDKLHDVIAVARQHEERLKTSAETPPLPIDGDIEKDFVTESIEDITAGGLTGGWKTKIAYALGITAAAGLAVSAWGWFKKSWLGRFLLGNDQKPNAFSRFTTWIVGLGGAALGMLGVNSIMDMFRRSPSFGPGGGLGGGGGLDTPGGPEGPVTSVWNNIIGILPAWMRPKNDAVRPFAENVDEGLLTSYELFGEAAKPLLEHENSSEVLRKWREGEYASVATMVPSLLAAMAIDGVDLVFDEGGMALHALGEIFQCNTDLWSKVKAMIFNGEVELDDWSELFGILIGGSFVYATSYAALRIVTLGKFKGKGILRESVAWPVYSVTRGARGGYKLTRALIQITDPNSETWLTIGNKIDITKYNLRNRPSSWISVLTGGNEAGFRMRADFLIQQDIRLKETEGKIENPRAFEKMVNEARSDFIAYVKRLHRRHPDQIPQYLHQALADANIDSIADLDNQNVHLFLAKLPRATPTESADSDQDSAAVDSENGEADDNTNVPPVDSDSSVEDDADEDGETDNDVNANNPTPDSPDSAQAEAEDTETETVPEVDPEQVSELEKRYQQDEKLRDEARELRRRSNLAQNSMWQTDIESAELAIQQNLNAQAVNMVYMINSERLVGTDASTQRDTQRRWESLWKHEVLDTADRVGSMHEALVAEQGSLARLAQEQLEAAGDLDSGPEKTAKLQEARQVFATLELFQEQAKLLVGKEIELRTKQIKKLDSEISRMERRLGRLQENSVQYQQLNRQKENLQRSKQAVEGRLQDLESKVQEETQVGPTAAELALLENVPINQQENPSQGQADVTQTQIEFESGVDTSARGEASSNVNVQRK